MSIRGFSSYLSFLDDTTGYPFSFPTCNKRTPLDILQFIIITLRQQNKSINYVQCDKGGELSCSSEVNKLLIENNIMVQSTGGYASNLNKDERSHRMNIDMIRCQLYTAKLPNKFWCYDLQHSTFACRRICSHHNTVSPYFQWH